MDSATTPRVVGRYVLYGELAAGGMATVHYGRLSGPVGFSRTVAIKRLHPQFAKDPEFVTMFLDEARLCGRIRHPNVVPTLDVVTNEGEIFLVMEYVAGESFARLLKAAASRGMRVPMRVAASILSSVLHGLNEAHQTKDEHGRELGIVHRDVSPQNILVGGDGIARVLDFGVAKAAGRLQTTREGQVKGKIAYMPPEQISGGTVTRQIDIYAAAVVLWEALAGRRLFDGETEAMVLVRALEGKIDPVSQYNPEAGPAIDALLGRGLARDPAARFATAREMALALEQTIGLASPSEVGAWVECVAGDELGLRARNVAEIEVASVTGTIPRNPTRADAADVHSQVSSISVSRPLSTRSGPGSRLVPIALAATGVAALAAAALVLLVARGGLERTATAGTAPPNTWVHERRPLTVTGPAMAPGKFVGESSPTPAAPTPGPAVVLAKKPPACDPPFTMDPVTGRKKYKVECFK